MRLYYKMWIGGVTAHRGTQSDGKQFCVAKLCSPKTNYGLRAECDVFPL